MADRSRWNGCHYIGWTELSCLECRGGNGYTNSHSDGFCQQLLCLSAPGSKRSDTHSHPDDYAYSNSDGYHIPYADRYTYGDVYPHRHLDADIYNYCNDNDNTKHHSDNDGYAYRDAHSYGHIYPDGHFHADRNAYPY